MRMKFFLPITSVVLSILALQVLCAQEEAPLPAKPDASPSPTPTAARPQLNIPEIPIEVEPPTLVVEPSPTIGGPRLGPALGKTAPPLSQLDAAFNRSPMGQAAEEQRLHREWRQLQNRATNDPEVVAAKEATTTAKTDLEKRVRLRTYYNIYYARMQALASTPDVKRYLEGKKAAALAGLAQTRVRSTPSPQSSRGR